jgi:L-serine kinase (ATP) / ParB family transcriptional regulator, heme-responsive regulator
LQQSDFQRDAELPVIKIVPVSNLVVHEHTDQERILGLVQRLEKDGLLKNPPIVAPIPGSAKYVVLDGANRTSALAHIGCRDAAVQIVDYNDPDLELLVWNHLIAAPTPDEVVEPLKRITGLRMRRVNLEMARALLANRGILAYVIRTDGPVLVLEGGLNLDDEAALLNEIVASYHGRLRYFRVKSDELKSLLAYYDGAAALFAFPCFQPEDVTHMASTGARLPAGITRHVIPQRALRINVPLHILQQDRPLEEKNGWLHEQIKKRLLNREIRYYQEPTVLFDE